MDGGKGGLVANHLVSPCSEKNSPNENMAALLEWPKRELAVLMTYKVNIVVMAQKKHLQVSLVDQKDAPCIDNDLILLLWRRKTRINFS